MPTTKDWRHVGPVTVRDDARGTVAFASLAAAVRRIGWHRVGCLTDGPHYGVLDVDLRLRVALAGPSYAPVLVLDECGMRIPAWRVRQEAVAIGLQEEEEARRVTRVYRNLFGRVEWDPATFRAAPVPGLRKGYCGRWHDRRMRTTQERRAAAGVVADEEMLEHGIRPRGARKAFALVNAWEDVPVGRQRSWKESRRTQYRERRGGK